MYRTTKEKSLTTDATCPECKSKSVLYKGGTISCSNCGHIIASPKVKKNKYNAVKTVARDGLKRDSKFEASVADELYLRKQAGDILNYESQYKVVLPIYDKHGNVAFTKNWKVDFRISENDGSYTLLEVKGLEGVDYKWKRDILENVWLKEHLDHQYLVRTQHKQRKRK